MVYTDTHTLMSCSHYMWAVVQREEGLFMVCEASPPSAIVDFGDPTHHQIPHTHAVNISTSTYPILKNNTMLNCMWALFQQREAYSWSHSEWPSQPSAVVIIITVRYRIKTVSTEYTYTIVFLFGG